MKIIAKNSGGFTLIELMISIAIFGVIMAGITAAYRAQIRSHCTQQEIMEMQQNIRAALYLMEKEIKSAGLNPTGTPGIGIITADTHTIDFSMDFTGGAGNGIDDDDDGMTDEGRNGLDDNGNLLFDEPDEAEWYDGDTNDPNERITYVLSNDVDADGQNDGLPGGACDLMRNGEILAPNMDALNFVYLNAAGAPLATPVADTTQIRSVQVSLVARSGAFPSNASIEYVDTQSYQNQQNTTILPQQNDNFRRILMSTEIRCRNMGLE